MHALPTATSGRPTIKDITMLMQVFARTPVWVYALFLVLLYLGYVQSKTRRISGAKLAALPVVLGAFSLYGVYSAFGAHATGIAGWGIGVMLALALNGVTRQPRDVTYEAAERVFTIPGSWIPLALMMAMFFTRYAVTVVLTTSPALADVAVFAAAVSLVYGLLSGTFLARAMRSKNAARETWGQRAREAT
jgi:hypothetical protein